MRRARTCQDFQSMTAASTADTTQQMTWEPIVTLAGGFWNASFDELCVDKRDPESLHSPSPPMKRRAKNNTSALTDPSTINYSPIAFSMPSSPCLESTTPLQNEMSLYESVTENTPPLLGRAQMGGESTSRSKTQRKLYRPSPVLMKTRQKSFGRTTNNNERPTTNQTLFDAIASVSDELQMFDLGNISTSPITSSHSLSTARSPYSGVPVSETTPSLMHQEMLLLLFGVFSAVCVAVGWAENTKQFAGQKY